MGDGGRWVGWMEGVVRVVGGWMGGGKGGREGAM